MTIQKKFITRAMSEFRKHDEMVFQATVGDRMDLAFEAWRLSEGTAHVFYVDGMLCVRGNRSEKDFALGFFKAWRLATRTLPVDQESE
jgi:hypothetical protein